MYPRTRRVLEVEKAARDVDRALTERIARQNALADAQRRLAVSTEESERAFTQMRIDRAAVDHHAEAVDNSNEDCDEAEAEHARAVSQWYQEEGR